MLKPEDLHLLPKTPGVYRFYDLHKNLLYVGKAKSLRDRVRSYFSASIKIKRTKQLVDQIAFIDYTLTADEKAALILENNLIQLLSPQFNILVREEGSLPVIESTKHKFPQLKVTKLNKANGIIYGPYPSKKHANLKLKFIKKVFKLRTCEEWEFKNRSYPCFNYQIKECSAPCIGKITADEYNKNLIKASLFLKGEYVGLRKKLKEEMLADAEAYLYEEARLKRDAIAIIKELSSLQIIFTAGKGNFDIILATQTKENLFISIVFVRAGIPAGDTYHIGKPLENIELFLVDYMKERYLESSGANCIYVDYELSCQQRSNVYKATGIKVLLMKNVRNKALLELNNKANDNFAQLIRNYSYQNLYLGGITSLKEIFGVVDKINIEYLYIQEKNYSIFIPHENIQELQITKLSNENLEIYILDQNKKTSNYFLFIEARIEQEKYIIEFLAKSELRCNIALVKSIPYGRDIILKLNRSNIFSHENLIQHNGIAKLVKLCQSLLSI